MSDNCFSWLETNFTCHKYKFTCHVFDDSLSHKSYLHVIEMKFTCHIFDIFVI